MPRTPADQIMRSFRLLTAVQQFIESPAVSGQEIPAEIPYLREFLRQTIDHGGRGYLGCPELCVSCVFLFDTLNEGRQLVRRLDKAPEIPLGIRKVIPVFCRKQDLFKGFPEVLRQKAQEPPCCRLFHHAISLSYITAVVFYRSGHISRDNLGRVVIEPQHCSAFRIQLPAVAFISDHTQGVGDRSHLESMFREVFRPGASHQGPSLDILHP